MTTIEAQPSVPIDTGARAFIATFMSHVAAVAGRGVNREATIARIETLLLSAIALGDGSSSATWSLLHRAIADLVAPADDVSGRSEAETYLRAFIRENGDLALP
jgi:hypothetical protein